MYSYMMHILYIRLLYYTITEILFYYSIYLAKIPDLDEFSCPNLSY